MRRGRSGRRRAVRGPRRAPARLARGPCAGAVGAGAREHALFHFASCACVAYRVPPCSPVDAASVGAQKAARHFGEFGVPPGTRPALLVMLSARSAGSPGRAAAAAGSILDSGQHPAQVLDHIGARPRGLVLLARGPPPSAPHGPARPGHEHWGWVGPSRVCICVCVFRRGRATPTARPTPGPRRGSARACPPTPRAPALHLACRSWPRAFVSWTLARGARVRVGRVCGRSAARIAPRGRAGRR